MNRRTVTTDNEPPTPDNADGSPPRASDLRQLEFLRLLGSSERSLQAYVLGLVGRRSDADDVLQETRIKLWKEFPRYDPSKSFAAWARAIAFFEVRSFRKRCVRGRLILSDDIVAKLSAQYEDLEGELSERHILLESCLKRLDKAAYSLLMRCYSSDKSQREIAEQLGRSPAGLRQSLMRIRKTLYDCISRGLAPAVE